MRKSVFLLVLLLFLSLILPAFSIPVVRATEDTWTKKAPMHEAREKLGVAAVNGKIYAIGGDTLSAFWTYSMGFSGKPTGGVVGTNEEYDPATNTWTFKTPMLTPRTGFAIASYKNKIYCIGGATSHDIYTGANLTAVNEVYNTATDTWETKAPMPTAIWGIPANAINGKIYVIDRDGKVYVYDITADSWSTKSTTPTPSAAGGIGHVSAVVNGKLHIIGGLSTSLDSNLHQVYDPAIDNWTYASFPPNCYIGDAFGKGAAGATTGELALKRIYVIGQPKTLVQCEPKGINRIYNPQNDSWTSGVNLPTTRINFGVAVVNDAIYVIGGGSATNWFVGTFGPSAVNERYTPIGYGTPDPSYVLEKPPKISVLSPVNETYNNSNVPLVYAVDKPVDWTEYSIDGKPNETITGNTTLTRLSNGLHNLTIYAQDTFGNIGTSENITFRVEVPEPFPTIPIAAASVAVVVAVCVGSLLYFKKRKR